MSNWGNNYNSNRSHNYYQNSHPSYQQVNGSNLPYDSWNDYRTGDATQPTQNSSMYIANSSGTQGRELNYDGAEYSQPNTNLPQSSSYNNLEISSEVWDRAANSQLTPTAGEFIPGSTYRPQSVHAQGPSQVSQSNDSQAAPNGVSSHNETVPKKHTAASHKVAASNPKDSSNHQRRNFGRDKSHSQNSNNQRQLSIEQSKAEGRKKLLQEAAGLATSKPDSSNTARGTHSRSSNESSRWQQQSSADSSHNSYKNSNNKVFSRSAKSQNASHQPQRYSPPRKSSTVGSFQPSRHKGCDDAASQRDRLIDQLNRGALECLVCCEHVRQTDHTWSCHNCYHVLHLRCIIKWADTSKADNGWRCPACQNVTGTTPHDYYCFCGKNRNPEWNRTDTAHSCGEVCDRPKVLASEHYTCVHHCTVLCHPGPCPPCGALVTRKCGCGKTSQSVQCGQTQPLVCSEPCDRPLTCGRHQCADKCHLGKCRPCQVIIKQVCHCGKDSQEVQCDGEVTEGDKFSCAKPCEGLLTCGHHRCEAVCHSGECAPCQRDPKTVTHCFCGKSVLREDQRRTSCLDPIPTCGQTCARLLSCGQPNSPHLCQSKCHEGQCPPCAQTTLVRCRCGYMDQEIPCVELTSKADDARCQKKCTKKRCCGKHKCNQMCCIDFDHLCPLPCNHMLTCGKHRCDQLCHRGHCQPCLQSSFEELFCECGSSVLLPPIPCGTKPPPCNKMCTRAHECDHEVLHTCHSYPACPPCTVLTTKHCHGKHELRKAVPCYMKEFSCGLPCGRVLPCVRHKCIQPCHSSNCVATCRQPCTKPRELCGHPCNAPCHDGDCVDTPCKENVVVTCECGHRSMSRPCYENNNEYQRIATSLLASKMADVQLGRSVNLVEMQGSRKFTIKTLECTEECRVVERNRRLAIGLQIRNPDLSAKLTPRYSEFMRGWAKKDHRFCQYVHDKLSELVKLAKESKQKSRSYSFETMNREKRQFVHEYCTHFGCESVAYDAEPKRNVVATAQRDKAWLPSYSLLEVVQREMGQRKVPLVNLNSSSQRTTSQSDVLPVRVMLNQPAKTAPAAAQDSPQIDYFDFNG